MVRTSDSGVNFGALYARQDGFGHAEVVNAPADGPCPGSAAEAPPGIGVSGVWVQAAEGVCKACLQKGGEPGALLVREAGGEVVCCGASKVDFLVRDVQVAAEDDGLFLIVDYSFHSIRFTASSM